MYRIVLPFLGFENISKLEVEKVDEFCSFLKFDEETKLSIINIEALNRVSFDFVIDKDSLEKLKINSKNDFKTYFIVVSQEPIEYSIVNLVAPVFINEKEKLIGQYVTNEQVEPYLASLNKCIHLPK